MTDKITFGIVGGGIGGLTLAIAMRQKGYDVTIYEAAPQWKPLGAGLGLAGNAVKAFQQLRIDEDVLAASQVLKKVAIRDHVGRMLMETDSEQISKTYGVVNNFSIHRADLHAVLISHLPEEIVRLGKMVSGLQQDGDSVTLKFKDGGTSRHDFVIGADGIHSAVRAAILPSAVPRYAGYTAWRAVVDDLPEDFDPSITSESWGRGARFGIVPLTRSRVYWFACVNARRNDDLMRALTGSDLMTYFKDFHHPVPDLLRRTKRENLIWNDIIDLPPLQRFAFDRVVLMGDAAHATTPNLGQGACMAIEDAVVLANCVASSKNPTEAFALFEQRRIQRTTKIVEDSWQLGRAAQLSNPLLIRLRNFALKHAPSGLAAKQFRFIYDISFS